MANATVSFNTNGLGTIFNNRTYYGYAEWNFLPNDNARIAYEWTYECDVTYDPEMEREPEHYTGSTRWSRDNVDGKPCLFDQYAWGSASYIENVTLVVTIHGQSNTNLLPHTVEPSGSGAYDYFWGWDRSRELSDGTEWYWQVHANGDYELSDFTKYYHADDGQDKADIRTYGHGTLTDYGTIVQNLSEGSWQYSKVFQATAHFWIPHLSVSLDPNDDTHTPVQQLSPSCVYIRCKDGDTYGTLPTPIRPGFTFDGWFTARSGRRRYGPLLPSSQLSTFYDHTVYASWTPNPTKVTASYYDVKNNVWLSSNSEVGTCTASPRLSAVETIPHLLSSVTISTNNSFYFAAYDDGTRYNTLSLLGTGEVYIYDYDVQKGIYHNFTTPHLFDYESYGYIYRSTGYIYPANNFDLTVMVSPKRTYTYLPMYLPSNGLLLRGVKVNKVIRDGDG